MISLFMCDKCKSNNPISKTFLKECYIFNKIYPTSYFFPKILPFFSYCYPTAIIEYTNSRSGFPNLLFRHVFYFL